MTWLKLSDDFHDECAGLSDPAYRTHVEGLGWVMRRETGGVVSCRDVRRFAETADPETAIEELLGRGLWQRESSGYRIVHHMQHQPEPEVLARRRELDAARQRKKRRKAVGLSSPEESRHESRRESRSDDTRDPGRDGTGRVGSGYQGNGDTCPQCNGEGCHWCSNTGKDPLNDARTSHAAA